MRVTKTYAHLMHSRKPCFWCRKLCEPAKLTRDHLVPLWALQLIPELPDGPGNIVKACGPCNGSKGGMPPALFFYVRATPSLREKAWREWQNIQLDIKSGHYNPALRDGIFAEMAKDYPTKPPVERAGMNGHPWKHAAFKVKIIPWVAAARHSRIA